MTKRKHEISLEELKQLLDNKGLKFEDLKGEEL